MQDWINSKPLTTSQLKGKVVLVDFWTYSCINCIRNNPHLESLYNAYKDDGLVVIGMHAPEFSFEKVPANVEKAVKDQHITYPVALDNNLDTWNAFNNRSWPASYLINPKGQVVRVHEGEGQYKEEEQAVRQLLQDNGAKLSDRLVESSDNVPFNDQQTPETYFGAERASNYAGSPALGAQPVQTFTNARQLPINGWSLGGTWEVQDDKIIARGDSTLRFKVAAKDVYVVGGSSSPVQMGVTLNGKPISQTPYGGQDVHDSMVNFGPSQLYRIVAYPKFTKGDTIELSVPDGTELSTFTFGG